jgi:hypothetical protein
MTTRTPVFGDAPSSRNDFTKLFNSQNGPTRKTIYYVYYKINTTYVCTSDAETPASSGNAAPCSNVRRTITPLTSSPTIRLHARVKDL